MGLVGESKTEVTLLACKVRGSKFVPEKGAKPKVYTWPQLIEHFKADRVEAKKTLRQVKTGAYIGLVTNLRKGTTGIFLMHRNDQTGDFSHVLKADPTFDSRVQMVMHVEKAQWPVTLQEHSPAPKAA